MASGLHRQKLLPECRISFSQPDLFGFLLSLIELSLLAKAMQTTPVSDELPNGPEVSEVCGDFFLDFSTPLIYFLSTCRQ